MSCQQIMGIFVTAEQRDAILPSGVPTFIAQSSEQQDELAAEFSRSMHGWVHKLSNGIILVTNVRG